MIEIFLPVISENLTANFGGILVITFPDKLHVDKAVCLMR